ncbi:MAG: ferritin [Chloroflexota bacterium]
MFNQRLVDAFNTQITNELNSAYIYFGMAAYFDSSNLPGFATWMRAQAQEEMAHALKIYDFVNERGADVKLAALDAPSTTYESPLAAFKAAYKHEQFISGTIHQLYKLAEEEGDYASKPLLYWFIEEQVEEEASAKEIVDQLEMVQDSRTGMYMLDKQLGERVFNAEEDEAAD